MIEEEIRRLEEQWEECQKNWHGPESWAMHFCQKEMPDVLAALRLLGEENARLRTLFADYCLDSEVARIAREQGVHAERQRTTGLIDQLIRSWKKPVRNNHVPVIPSYEILRTCIAEGADRFPDGETLLQEYHKQGSRAPRDLFVNVGGSDALTYAMSLLNFRANPFQIGQLVGVHEGQILHVQSERDAHYVVRGIQEDPDGRWAYLYLVPIPRSSSLALQPGTGTPIRVFPSQDQDSP